MDAAARIQARIAERAANPPGDQGAGGESVFDPADHTIDEIRTYVADHPDERGPVLQAEVSGKNRSTLVSWLEDDE